jgi:5-methyltetrahydropteroyltriglutamate--homocysteine methyltransferase
MLFPLARDPAELIDTQAYRRRDEVFPDLVRAYRAGIRALYDAGCRYLQLDECNLSISCDPAYRQRIRDRGEDPERVIGAYVDLINDAVSDRPRDMMVAMHHCRGNFRSSWMAEGGYEPIADLLFNKVDIDVHFMEYDDQRSGGFEPLRLMPKDKYLVLGLISSKRGQLEAKDEIKRRIDEASRYVDAAHLCLSPQCGFSSTEEGNVLSEDEQWAKLALTLEIADEVWGRA